MLFVFRRGRFINFPRLFIVCEHGLPLLKEKQSWVRVCQGAMTDNVVHLLSALISLSALHLIDKVINFITVI